MGHGTEAGFDAGRLRYLFGEIGRRLRERRQVAEIAVFGGSALVLTFDYREATRDIDYVPLVADPRALEEVASEIGQQENLPENWLNDAVRIFTSDTPDYRLVGDFPDGKPGLRVYSASPRYLLAMKIMSMRSSLETNDVLDVWNLIDACGVRNAEEAAALTKEFFPSKDIPRRNQLLLEDVFEAKGNNQAYSRAIGW